uniref:DUF148 domain-containing protein n=1 Tax=Rhabditophanes sp. KR3021 TaxID=114890 RepID=A0AC35TQI2_9BILA
MKLLILLTLASLTSAHFYPSSFNPFGYRRPFYPGYNNYASGINQGPGFFQSGVANGYNGFNRFASGSNGRGGQFQSSSAFSSPFNGYARGSNYGPGFGYNPISQYGSAYSPYGGLASGSNWFDKKKFLELELEANRPAVEEVMKIVGKAIPRLMKLISKLAPESVDKEFYESLDKLSNLNFEETSDKPMKIHITQDKLELINSELRKIINGFIKSPLALKVKLTGADEAVSEPATTVEAAPVVPQTENTSF